MMCKDTCQETFLSKLPLVLYYLKKLGKYPGDYLGEIYLQWDKVCPNGTVWERHIKWIVQEIDYDAGVVKYPKHTFCLSKRERFGRKRLQTRRLLPIDQIIDKDTINEQFAKLREIERIVLKQLDNKKYYQCYKERWCITRVEYRLTNKQLGEFLGISATRIQTMEKRFYRLVKEYVDEQHNKP